MLNRFRLPLLLAVISILVVAGVFYMRKVRPVPVVLAQSERNVEVRVFGIGTIEAQVLSKVGFQVSGRIDALLADQGEIVEAGAPLATLDDRSQRARVAKAEVGKLQADAAAAKAKAILERSEANLQQKSSVNQRRQSLVDRGSVSREAADDAQTNEVLARSDHEIAKADVLVAEAARHDVAATLAIEQVLLDQHRLVAPFRARILARLKEAGSVAAVGEAVFSLIEPNSIWVRAFVDEAKAGGLRVGQKAMVRLRSEMNIAVEAEIVRIDQENDRVTEERRIYVRCTACVPEHQARFLGEQAEIEIIKRVVPEGVFIPLRNIEKFDGRSGTIWTVENDTLARRTVALADTLLDGRILIAGGMPEGARAILTTPDTGFAVGRKVAIRESGAP